MNQVDKLNSNVVPCRYLVAFLVALTSNTGLTIFAQGPPREVQTVSAVKNGMTISRDLRKSDNNVVGLYVGPSALIDDVSTFLAKEKTIPRLQLIDRTDAEALLELFAEKSVANLGLSNCSLTSQIFARIGKLGTLRMLFLKDMQLELDGFKSIAGLKCLDFGYANGKLKADCLRILGESKTIEGFTFMSCDMTKEDVKSLRHLQRARFLTVTDGKLDDSDVEVFAELPELRVLQLDGNKLSDDGLKKIIAHKKLEHLILRRTKVSKAAIENASKEHPKLLIDRD